MIGLAFTVGFIIIFMILMEIDEKVYGMTDGSFILEIPAFLSFILAAISFILTIICFIVQMNNIKLQKPQSIDILSLQDSQNVSGSYYILGGHIDENLYYYMMYDTDKGATPLKLEADECYINESNNNKPHIDIYKARCENEFVDWYLWTDQSHDVYYKIYVPKGTVDKSFKVDLK